MTGLKHACASLCVIAAISLVAGCTVVVEPSRMILQGSCVTVEMTERVSQDRWPGDGPVRLIAQNKFCAIEIIQGT